MSLRRTLLRPALKAAISPWLVRCLGEPFFWGIGRRVRHSRKITETRRILIVRLDAIGDMVLTTPFIREVRKSLPQPWITLVVAAETFNLVELCPYVNEVLAFKQPTPGRFMELRKMWNALKFAAAHLWHRRFEVALVPRWDVDHYAATFLAYFSGAQCRIGYSEKATNLKALLNRGYDSLYSEVFNDAQLKHEVVRNLDLLTCLGLTPTNSTLELWTSEEDNLGVQRLLKTIQLKEDETLIALALGTKEEKKIWPLVFYIEVGKWLLERFNIRLILLGGTKEVELGQRFLMEVHSAINLIGKLSLRQCAVLLSHCQLYVGNDTGPMHLAAAVGTPIVEICCHPASGDVKHYTSPARFGPWGVPCRVLRPARGKDICTEGCKSLEPHCILGVRVDDVQHAIDSLLTSHLQVMAAE